MAPVLIANVLTVAFVYSFVKIGQKERSGEENGRGNYLWLILLVLLFVLYGLYTWGVYLFKDCLRGSSLGEGTGPAPQAGSRASSNGAAD